MKKILFLIFLLNCSTVNAHDCIVERVIDGNTMVINVHGKSEKVRLIGMDIPHSGKNAQMSTEFLKSFELVGKDLRLEYDAQERDERGLLLAYAYFYAPKPLSDTYDSFSAEDRVVKGMKGPNYTFYEIFLNAKIMKDGYAYPKPVSPNTKYADLFLELYKESRENKRGLWKVNMLTEMTHRIWGVFDGIWARLRGIST